MTEHTYVPGLDILCGFCDRNYLKYAYMVLYNVGKEEKQKKANGNEGYCEALVIMLF